MLAPRSVIQHRYEFSRSIAKWYWMERNRLAVVIKNYRWLTLIVLAFPLLAVEIATILFSFIGGWWREKFRAMGWFFTSSTWAYLLQSRGQISRLRKIPDRLVFEFFTPVIAYQEFESPFMTAVANPLMRLSFAVIKLIVRW